MSIGERISFYRARRGLTQTQLANLVGRRVDWLSKIERGDRQLRNIELLTALARVLRVSLTDLMGQPILLEDEHERDDIPAVRDALMAPNQLSRTLFARLAESTAAVDAEQSSRLIEIAWYSYQAGRIGDVVASLPRLIRQAQLLEQQADSEPLPT